MSFGGWSVPVDATLVVIGLNHRTAPVAVRERFWINESRRYEALVDLGNSEGIDELVLLATWNRTEFVVWSSDAAAAANSVLRFLTRAYGLNSSEWQSFYRLLDKAALTNVFRTASGLDSPVTGDPDAAGQVQAAWEQARKVGTTGRLLDAVFQKALAVSERVRKETSIISAAVSIPHAAAGAAKKVFGSLNDCSVMVLGSGKMNELAAHHLAKQGARKIVVVNRTPEQAQELADSLGAKVATFEQRWEHLHNTDIVISSTACPHVILTRDEVAGIAAAREKPLCLIDMAVPRDIDPAARTLDGVFLYDIDDLERMVRHGSSERQAAIAQAEEIIDAEAAEFRAKLAGETVVPTIVALRHRLDAICRSELEEFKRESGPFGEFQDQLLQELASRITQRIAASLARELKFTEKVEEERMTAALQRLFQLEQVHAASARTQN
jgi:glutamyl-tRNA reductase